MIGKKVFHFEVLEKIGSGGMGVVYKAKDTKLDRLVALKFLGKNLTDDEESRARFLNEARTISTLDHPNIASVHAIEEFEDTIFICLGYYQGETLKEFLDKDYTFSTEEICSIIEQIALGLKEAHNTGITHRDIKPANIFLTQNNQVKILDFGLAKMQKSVELTQPNVVLGTASYMAPEQIIGDTVSRQSDLFSFGCVMYEIITGNKPFPGDSPLSVSYSIMNSQPKPIKNTRADIPDELESIVHKALEKRPESRYQSATEILADLDEIKKVRARNGQVNRKGSFQNKVLALAVISIIAGFFLFDKVTNVSSEAASIVVLPFQHEAMPEAWNWVSPVLTDLVISHLGKSGDIRVLNSQQKDKILKSLELKNKKLTKENALQIARKAKMQLVLMGTLKKENNLIQLNAFLLDGETGNPIKNYENITEPAQLAGLASRLSSMVRQSFNLKEKTKRDTKEKKSEKEISLDAYRFYIEGKDAAFDLRHQESIEKLSKAIQIDSTFIKAYFHLAHEYARIGETGKAKTVLRKGKPYLDNLSQIDRLEYLCNEAAFESRWQNYITYLEKLKQLNPHDASVFYRYGWVQNKKFNQIEAGIQAMKKALEIDSTDSRPYNSLSYAYLRNSQPAQAMKIIDTFVRLNPMDINPRDSRAEILMLTGRYKEAFEECGNILMMRPDFVSTPILMTRILTEQGKLRAALKTINRYLERQLSSVPKSQALTVKANILYKKNELASSESVAKMAVKIDSINFEAYWMQGLIFLKQQKLTEFKDTLALLKFHLEREGGFDGRWFLYHLKGEFAIFENKIKEAITHYSNGLKVNPTNRSFYLTALGKAHLLNQQYAKAISTLDSALEFNRNNALANFYLANAYEENQNFENALKAYQKFLKVWAEADPKQAETSIATKRLNSLKLNQKLK